MFHIPTYFQNSQRRIRQFNERKSGTEDALKQRSASVVQSSIYEVILDDIAYLETQRDFQGNVQKPRGIPSKHRDSEKVGCKYSSSAQGTTKLEASNTNSPGTGWGAHVYSSEDVVEVRGGR